MLVLCAIFRLCRYWCSIYSLFMGLYLLLGFSVFYSCSSSDVVVNHGFPGLENKLWMSPHSWSELIHRSTLTSLCQAPSVVVDLDVWRDGTLRQHPKRHLVVMMKKKSRLCVFSIGNLQFCTAVGPEFSWFESSSESNTIFCSKSLFLLANVSF